MSTDYGTDFDCEEDLLTTLGVVSGRIKIAKAILRRLITPKGGLYGYPDYGFRIADYLNDDVSKSDLGWIASQIKEQCLREEAVNGVEVVLSLMPTGVLVVRVMLDLADGPFEFVLSVSQAITKLEEV